MSDPHLANPVALRQLHDDVRRFFHVEAGLMRGYAYWVPVVPAMEDKVTAAHLVYLHMRNADALHRLLELLRLETPSTPFGAQAVEMTLGLQAPASFAEVRAAYANVARFPHLAEITAYVERTNPLFDYYIVETLAEITARYSSAIWPALSRPPNGRHPVASHSAENTELPLTR